MLLPRKVQAWLSVKYDFYRAAKKYGLRANSKCDGYILCVGIWKTAKDHSAEIGSDCGLKVSRQLQRDRAFFHL